MKISYLALCIGTSVVIAACGGGSSSNSSNSTPTPPEPTPTSNFATSGTITGFGSVYVDGEKFDTDDADIEVNGDDGNIEQLKVGMQIKLSYEKDDDGNSVATDVEYERSVEGNIDAIERDTQTITIAGLVIHYNDQTHFIETTISSLSVGDRIEISGYLQEDGSVIASYIELENDSSDSNTYLSGVLSALDTVQQTFAIGSSVVDYSAANVDVTLADGITVKVEGMVIDNILVASEVEADGYDFSDREYSEVEIEGVVTSFDAITGILVLHGEQYQVTSATEFEDGSADTLMAGDYIELKLDMSSDSPVVTKIEIKTERVTEADGKLKGLITDINQTDNTFTVNDIVFMVIDSTRYEDEDDQYFHFSSLQLNDYVELVYDVQDNSYIVLRIEREHEDEDSYKEVESKGEVTEVSAEGFVVNGVSYLFTDASLLILDHTIVTVEEFAASLIVGMYLEIEGYYNDADELIIEKFKVENRGDDQDDEDGDDSSDDDEDTEDDEDSGDDDTDDGDSGDNDDSQTGYVELESRVTAILSDNAFVVNGIEIHVDETTRFEVNDNEHVTLEEFMTALAVGIAVEVEGSWVNSEYVQARKAEIDD